MRECVHRLDLRRSKLAPRLILANSASRRDLIKRLWRAKRAQSQKDTLARSFLPSLEDNLAFSLDEKKERSFLSEVRIVKCYIFDCQFLTFFLCPIWVSDLDRSRVLSGALSRGGDMI